MHHEVRARDAGVYLLDAADGQDVAGGLAAELVGAVAGADGDGERVHAGVAHEVGGLLGVAGYYWILTGWLDHSRASAIDDLVGLAFGGSLISVFARLGGGIYTKAAPIHLSNLSLIDPKSADGKPKPTRVGFIFQKDGKKVRVAKRSGEVING